MTRCTTDEQSLGKWLDYNTETQSFWVLKTKIEHGGNLYNIEYWAMTKSLGEIDKSSNKDDEVNSLTENKMKY